MINNRHSKTLKFSLCNNKQIIDCHTHIQTPQLVKEYFKKRSGYAIVIKSLDNLIGDGDEFYNIANDKRIFILECVDVLKDINTQLDNIKRHLNTYNNIVGIKIYLGYQPVFADDKRFNSIHEFAEKNKLSICFHCGVVSNQCKLKTYNEFTTSLPIDRIAVNYPNVNFIISHFDVPNFLPCANIVQKNKNIYTDISGILENMDGINIKGLMNQLEKDIKSCYIYFPSLLKKIMFGTDYYGIGSGFDYVNEYEKVLRKVFGSKNAHYFLFVNCINAYPRIQELLEKN